MNLLEMYIKEAAKSLKEAGSFALYVSAPPENPEFNGDKVLILYNPQAFMSAMESGSTWDGYMNFIIGIVELEDHHGDCNNASETKKVAAQKGYGPMMYDIAGSFAPGLLPDRDSVSSAARNVWQHYYNKRGDIKPQPLDDDCDTHGDEVLDNSYHGFRTNPRSLFGNHKKALELAIEMGIDQEQYAYDLEEAASLFFFSNAGL